MINLQIKMYADKAKRTLRELTKRVGDMKPVWKNFINYYQTDAMPRSFNSKGAFMEGGRWAALTPKYLKWKMSSKNKGSRKLLVLSGEMFNAAKGGAGWYDKMGKQSLEMGTKGKEYYYWVQHRKTNPRHYFYTKDEDLPNKSWAYLIKITEEFLEEADK